MKNFLFFITAFVSTLLLTGLLQVMLSKYEGRYVIDDLLLRKIHAYQEDTQEFDAVFLGSSKIYRQVDTLKFDKIVGSVQPGFRSFNFGVPAMTWPEANLILEKLLNSSTRLKFVFIDPMDDAPLDPDFLTTDRVLFSHSPHGTELALKTSLLSDLPWLEKLVLVRLHLQALLYRLSSVGTFARAFELATNLRNQTLNDDERELGFVALDYIPNSAELRQRRLVDRKGDYEKALQRLRIEASYEPSRERIARVNELMDLVSSAGLVPVLLKSADLVNLMKLPANVSQNANGLHGLSISFTDPALFPQFYSLENRFDFSHLNARGAELYTEALAREVLNSKLIR